MIAAIVRALVATGATPEMILAAVEAAETHGDDALARRRASDAARQQRRRDRNVTSRDVTVTGRDAPVPPKPKVPPTPPSKTQPPLTPRPSLRSGSADFAQFWMAYPRKVGKGAASKSYVRAVHRADGPDPAETILAGLERSKRAWAKRDEPEFIPHPSTWLNQDRWLDDPETGEVITFTPPPLTPQQQADLEAINAERRNQPQAGLRPVDALGALASGG